ncbi:MAG: hypothetical protein V1867_07900 [Candidatus Falkowbacteria bacterium]
MKMIKHKRILLALVSFFFLFLFFAAPAIKSEYRWFKIKRAISAIGYPEQLGLTNIKTIQCVVSCDGACCQGGALCSALTPADCPKTQEVSGMMAGGTGNMALFAIEDLSTSGVKAGGQLIAGMTSITMPKANVCLAGRVGCVGTCCGGF